MLPVRKLSEISVSWFSVSCSNESPRACGAFRYFPQLVSNARGRDRFALRLLLFSAKFDLKYIINCLPSWSWPSLGKSNFFIRYSTVHAIMALSLEILGGKCATISHCPWVSAEARGTTCQMNLSTNPCSFHTPCNFVAQLVGGSGFETPTHIVESENT